MTGVTIGWPIVIVLAALAQSPGGGRQQQVPGPSLEGSPSAPQSATPGDKAFSRLFTKPAPAQNMEHRDRRQALENQKPKTKVVCGMVVIQADPSLDPKFVIRAPVDSSTQKILRIPPATCVE